MRYRILAAILFLLGFVCPQAMAQKRESTLGCNGVVNGSAVSLPMPEYPPTARAVGASGAVNVQVTIDVEGNVISATAISGHPLLRQVSVDAAKKAKFKPTLLVSQMIKISGILVYNFAPSETLLTWRSVGYEMAVAEQAPELPLKFPANSMHTFVPASWENERVDILKLKAVQTSLNNSGKAQGQFVTAGGTADIASIDHKEIIGSLKAAFENRLNSQQNDLWNFKLGLLLGKIYAQINDDGALRMNMAEFQQLEANAPAHAAKQLRPLSDLANKNEFSPEDKAQIQALAVKLRAY